MCVLHRMAPNDPPACPAWGGVELPQRFSRRERPSVLRVRADWGSRLFAAKLVVVVHDLPHQLLDHLLADEPILLARHLCLDACSVLFLNRGPKSLSMWGAEVGITPGRMKR